MFCIADPFERSALHICIKELASPKYSSAERHSYLHIIESARILLRRGADVNLRDSDGQTPLMHAVLLHQPVDAELTTMLLLYAPDLEVTDGDGWTALTLAI